MLVSQEIIICPSLSPVAVADDDITAATVKRKMDCFYLMMQVELALALALGGIEEADLPHQKLDDAPGLDTDHIEGLATELQTWLSKRAEMSDALFIK